MMTSAAAAKAKEFVVDRVIDQARRENVLLTEVEIRMLGFSEPSAGGRESEAPAISERSYGDEEYEAKIARLLGNVYERDVAGGMKPEWDRNLDEIADEDMYLLVMLEKAGIMKTTTSFILPDWRMAWGLVPALIFVALGIAVAFTPFGARLVPNLFVRLAILVVLWSAPFLIGRLRRRSAGS
jgi:hypothetical protein